MLPRIKRAPRLKPEGLRAPRSNKTKLPYSDRFTDSEAINNSRVTRGMITITPPLSYHESPCDRFAPQEWDSHDGRIIEGEALSGIAGTLYRESVDYNPVYNDQRNDENKREARKRYIRERLKDYSPSAPPAKPKI